MDTHGHVNFNAFREDSAEVLRRSLDSETWVVMPGSQFSTSKRAVEIAEKYEQGVYAAVGLHPIHLSQRRVGVEETQSERKEENDWEGFETRAEEFEYEQYKELAKSNKVVAVGEIGLDYYYFPKSKARRAEIKQRQKDVLMKEFQLAEEFNLPVILHCRVAHEDLLEFLAEHRNVRGVVHSYTGTVEQAKKFMDLGLSFGFNGLIFKNVPALPSSEEVIGSIPLDRIVLETDSPYLVPPQAGVERAEPIFVKYIAEEIARIKKMSIEEVAKTTTQNAKNLFSIS